MYPPRLTESHRRLIIYWLPALASGAAAGLVFLLLGHTPLIRAAALTATVVGLSMALRHFGAALAIIGGLALAFSPAFWSQTGGPDSPTFNLIALALLAALLATGGVFLLGKRISLGLAAGVVVFALLFWLLVGTPRSLRLTTFLSAWLLFLLIDALLTANPRPDGPPPASLRPYHTFGLLLVLTVGTLNDPLFVLLAPAAALGLFLTRTPLPRWFWLALLVVMVIGARGVAVHYLDSGWWLYPAASAEALSIRVPFVMADGWREASRWVYLFQLVGGQFTAVGVLLGVLGLARLARWYPPLGEVTMIAYAGYALFGLVYFGRDSAVLLLPLLMIQVFWMTYAVHTLGQWVQKAMRVKGGALAWFAPAAFVLLPLLLLLRIAGAG